jgi:hypothetical protein
MSTSSTIRLFGDYDLLHEVSRGGMGIVYRALQRSLGRQVALKMILEGRLASAEAVQRFRQEARAAAGLDHPGIVPVYEVGECEGHHFFTMAFVEGTTLSALVDNRGPLPAPEAARVMRAVAGAIDYAHRRGIVHRDLKPSNILIDSEGRARVTDFGLAKSLGDAGGLTSPGQVVGTPSFMAPEQAMGNNQQVGPAADVYALGGVLYYVLTGRPPFCSESMMDLLQQVVYQPPAAPRTLCPEVPRGLEEICLNCLQKEPSRRPASAAEVAAALEPWCTADAGTVPAPRPRPASLLRWAAAGMVVAALLAAGVVWMVRSRSEDTNGGGSAAAANTNTGRPDPAVKVNPPPNVPRTAQGKVDATRHDFGLHLDMLGARKDELGRPWLTEKDKVRLQVKVDHDAYVGIWSVDADGTIVQLFPNSDDLDNHVFAGKARLVPPPNSYSIDAVASGGVDQLYVIASTVPWEPIPGQKNERFVVFQTPDHRKGWDRARREIRDRGLRVRPKDKGALAVAEEVVPFRVLPPGQAGKK